MTYDELRQDQKDFYDANPAAKAQFDLVGTY